MGSGSNQRLPGKNPSGCQANDEFTVNNLVADSPRVASGGNENIPHRISLRIEEGACDNDRRCL